MATPFLPRDFFDAALLLTVRIDIDDNGQAVSGTGFLLQVQHLLDVYEYELRPPFTMEDVARGPMGLSEGLALQRIADPDALNSELFGQVILALMLGVIRRAGDEASLHDVLNKSGLDLN